MCDTACIIFGAINLTKNDIEGKRVIEIGSYDENGSLRAIIENLKPAKYTGVDIRQGPGVDVISNVENLMEKFGPESFDVVIATELIEHVKNWREALKSIKNICRRGGVVLLTTRSKGFDYHLSPYDFWRYEVSDMEYIFSDFSIEKLEIDKYCPGVFLKARRPANFIEKDLSGYELYSIILKARAREVTDKEIKDFVRLEANLEGSKRIVRNLEHSALRIIKFFLPKI